VPVPGAQFEETLAAASPDVLREMVRAFAQRMMDAEVEVRCGAAYGEVSPDRVNSRNGYRAREWDTRAGTVELAIPKLRQGSYFPSFLEHRRRAERALASVVATSYLLGVSTRRVEKLAASLGVVGLSKSQVSAMAAELDELVDSFRNRPLDAGPYTFVQLAAEPEGPRGRPHGERALPDRDRRERRRVPGDPRHRRDQRRGRRGVAGVPARPGRPRPVRRRPGDQR
jgi:transposase-like protein